MHQFDANPETGIPDTAGYPVFSHEPVRDEKAAERAYWSKRLRDVGKGKVNTGLNANPPAPHIEVPYESLVDADVPAGYVPLPIPLTVEQVYTAERINTLADEMAAEAVRLTNTRLPVAQPIPDYDAADIPPCDSPATTGEKPCCRRREAYVAPKPEREVPGDPTRVAVNEVLRVVADVCPIIDLAKALRYSAAGHDGLRLFPSKVVYRLALHVIDTHARTVASGSKGAANPA